MTRKHFEVIADSYGRTLADLGGEEVDVRRAARDLALSLKQFNPRLDTDRFIEATLVAWTLSGGGSVPARGAA